MLRISLFGPPKRRKQPERYTPCFRFSGYINRVTIDFKKEKKSFENYSLMGQLNTITIHGIAIKTDKKQIFQYIIRKVEHMDAIMPQNSRRFFVFDW
jgi:hypothetical protein